MNILIDEYCTNHTEILKKRELEFSYPLNLLSTQINSEKDALVLYCFTSAFVRGIESDFDGLSWENKDKIWQEMFDIEYIDVYFENNFWYVNSHRNEPKTFFYRLRDFIYLFSAHYKKKWHFDFQSSTRLYSEALSGTKKEAESSFGSYQLRPDSQIGSAYIRVYQGNDEKDEEEYWQANISFLSVRTPYAKN